MKTNPTRLSIALAGAAVLALSMSGCDKRDAISADLAMPTVDVAPVVERKITQWDEYNGRVSAVDSAEIRARVSGYITRVAYREGSEVRRGDLLFVIDQRPYLAALDTARAQLARARAIARNARRQDERAQSLLKANAVSREEAEQKHASRNASLADLHAAEAAVELARLNLDYTEVRAPFDGRTSRARITVGNLVTADQSVLTSVVTQDPVYVDFSPDEQSYLRYRGLSGQRGIGSSTQIGLVDDTNYPYRGKVEFLDNQIDPSTGTIQMRALAANPDRLFVPGMYARVRFAAVQNKRVLLISDRAILHDQDRAYVYVLGKGNQAIRTQVKVGRKIEGLRVIESGLTPRSSIVVAGLQKIGTANLVVDPKVIRLGASGSTPEPAPGGTRR